MIRYYKPNLPLSKLKKDMLKLRSIIQAFIHSALMN